MATSSKAPTLARKLRLHDYFALAFGTMIGTGWLVLMDDWLGRGGPLGAILGFVLGGIVLLPVGYVYGQWVLRLPDAAGEAAYTAQVFPPVVSYFTGWIMLLAYFIVCPWEAIALGKIAAYIFPQLDSIEVYRVAGQPVFFWRLVLGVALTLFLTFLNYRGIRLSANFQKGMTSVVLLIFIALVAISAARGTPANLHPVFHGTPLVSILLTLQIVPYFLTGFESVPKYAEEANPDLRGKTYMTAIAMALGIGVSFYALSLFAVSYIAPWQSLLGKRFATAIAFEHGLGAHWPVQLIFTMAMFGLFQCFNGNFAASTRMIFAFGRNGSIPATVFASPSAIPDAEQLRFNRRRRHARRTFSRRRAAGTGHRGWLSGVGVRLARIVRFDGSRFAQLCAAIDSFAHRRDFRSSRCVRARRDEVFAVRARPFHCRRIHRAGDLASARICSVAAQENCLPERTGAKTRWKNAGETPALPMA